ncbi:MAG: hypothetical protein MI863_15790 [Desulfobacterales bacterium]|nr:hypothetical protein [Desulfobacterales bacterium]
MEENRFFRLIWRINAVVIFIAGLLTVAGLVYGIVFLFQSGSGPHYTEDIVNTETGPGMVEEWHLERFEPVTGTQVVVASLVSDQAYDQDYFDKETYSVRNLLFINTRTNTQTWLMDTSDYLLADYHHLTETDWKQKEKAVGFLYVIVKKDTNTDRRLSNEDLKTISVSRPDGSRHTELVKGVDELLDYTLVDNTTVLISYRKGGDIYTGYISFDTLEFHRESKIRLKKTDTG